jgi:hypothetical protein
MKHMAIEKEQSAERLILVKKASISGVPISLGWRLSWNRIEAVSPV